MTAPATAKKKAPPRVAPEITTISTAVVMPVRASTRGSKTLYPFDDLPFGGSFGVKNKTAEQLTSIISNQNRKPGAVKKNPDGSVVYKMQEMKDPNGAVIGHVPTTEPEHEPAKHFFAVNVDKKKDPDQASVRVFRDK